MRVEEKAADRRQDGRRESVDGDVAKYGGLLGPHPPPVFSVISPAFPYFHNRPIRSAIADSTRDVIKKIPASNCPSQGPPEKLILGLCDLIPTGDRGRYGM
jgi:hypothetical protein